MSLSSTIRKTATKVATLTKSMMPSGSSVGMLNNKWILYAVLFISIVDLFNFFSKGDTTAIMIFVVAGFLTTYFSKNMLVILVIALAITHIVRFGNASIEGMEGEEEEEEEEDKVDEGMAGEAEGEAKEDKDEEKANGKKADGKKAVGKEVDELQKIAESLKTMEAIHPDEAITKTETLINQTKMVQENMELLEPYLKQAEKVTKPLTKSEGFCDYSSAYKR